MSIVRVLWRDAYHDYEGESEPHTDYLVSTAGHLLAEGPTFVSIAMERLPEGTYRAITHIPCESVVELARLEA